VPVRGVVITGAGLVSPLGKSVGETLDGISSGKSGISKITRGGGWPEFLKYAGSVAELPDMGEVNRKLLSQMKFLNRGALLGFHSAREAVESSGINLEDVPMERRALYLASGDMTNIDHHFLYEALKDATGGRWEQVDTAKLNTASLSKVNPFFLLESITNNLFSFLSSYYGLMGPNTSMGTLSPGGSNSVELAARSIAQGRADVALAVGCGSWIGEVSTYELHGLGVISDMKDGAASFKPFDASRDGFIPGEGGATLLLEFEEKAKARGAKILGRIKGTGNSIEHTGGESFIIPDRVHQRSVREALADAEVNASELGMVIAHGSATRRGDSSELSSIAGVLGGAGVPLCGLKPYTGHMGAASDVGEVIIGLNSISSKAVPATLNFRSADKEFSGLRISSSAQTAAGGSFLSISYGVGGQASAVVVEVG
jgi:3-oxoacyl-[acyl-carrier-protein] synthase II